MQYKLLNYYVEKKIDNKFSIYIKKTAHQGATILLLRSALRFFDINFDFLRFYLKNIKYK